MDNYELDMTLCILTHFLAYTHGLAWYTWQLFMIGNSSCSYRLLLVKKTSFSYADALCYALA